jgi:hypothetical protein
VERFFQRGTELIDVDAALREQGPHGAAFLIEQRRHDVNRLDELVIVPQSQALRFGQGCLEFTGQFVHSHWKNAFMLLNRDASIDWGAAPGFQAKPAMQSLVWILYRKE